jgi:hypothetical protein
MVIYSKEKLQNPTNQLNGDVANIELFKTDVQEPAKLKMDNAYTGFHNRPSINIPFIYSILLLLILFILHIEKNFFKAIFIFRIFLLYIY